MNNGVYLIWLPGIALVIMFQLWGWHRSGRIRNRMLHADRAESPGCFNTVIIVNYIALAGVLIAFVALLISRA